MLEVTAMPPSSAFIASHFFMKQTPFFSLICSSSSENREDRRVSPSTELFPLLHYVVPLVQSIILPSCLLFGELGGPVLPQNNREHHPIGAVGAPQGSCR